MRINSTLTLPIAVTLASLVTGVVVAPPIHLVSLRAESAASVAVDGGGPVNLALPWDKPVAPATPLPVDPSLTGITSPLVGADGAAPSASGAVNATPAVVVTGSASGIPANVLVAYQHAAQAIVANDPSCHLPWPILAGIGKVESGHARGGELDATGRTLSPILGPVLNGAPGVAAIPDSDGGRWDGDSVWDRAVGPMQFIPSSWRAHSVDGNGDGNADPSNIYDSTLAAAGYLCTGGRDLSRTSDLRQAVFGYNHSWPYVNTVLAWATAYANGEVVAVTPVSGAGGTVAVTTGSPAGNGTPTGRPTKRPRPTASRTPTPAVVPVMTPTPNPAPSVTAAAEPTMTMTTEPSPVTTPTDVPTPTPTPTESGCPTESESPSPTDSETPTDSPTATATDTATPTPMPTPTPTDPTATPSPTGSPTESPTSSPTPTDPCATPTPSPSPTVTDSETPSPSPSPTDSATPSPSTPRAVRSRR
jgi:Transglycosylase SLT domain